MIKAWWPESQGLYDKHEDLLAYKGSQASMALNSSESDVKLQFVINQRFQSHRMRDCGKVLL